MGKGFLPKSFLSRIYEGALLLKCDAHVSIFCCFLKPERTPRQDIDNSKNNVHVPFFTNIFGGKGSTIAEVL